MSLDPEGFSTAPVLCCSKNFGSPLKEILIASLVGITAYSKQRIHDIVSSFICVFDQSVLNTITAKTNREGRRLKGNEWKNVATMEMEAYIGLCILRGVFKSNKESICQLLITVSRRPIFGNTIARNQFEDICKILRFDSGATTMARLRNDRLALLT